MNARGNYIVFGVIVFGSGVGTSRTGEEAVGGNTSDGRKSHYTQLCFGISRERAKKKKKKASNFVYCLKRSVSLSHGVNVFGGVMYAVQYNVFGIAVGHNIT